VRSACDEVLSPQEREASSASIERLQKEMIDSRYQDVSLIKDLARMLLVRDEETPHADGSNDAERAQRNALRAVAVSPTDPGARFILTLTLMRSFQGNPPRSLEQRWFLLQLLESRLSLSGSADGLLAAAQHAVRGQLALERNQASEAIGAFRAALALDPKLAVAHHGLGDAARTTGDFAAAKASFHSALALDSGDVGVLRSLGSAERNEPLQYRALPASIPIRFVPGPLGSVPPAIQRCPARATKAPDTQAFCTAVASLADSTGNARRVAAEAVLGAFSALSPCKTQQPGCGDFVARALLDAAHVFRATGALGKTVATLRMLQLDTRPLPGSERLSEESHLLLADSYFDVAMYDRAAEAYAKVFAASGAQARAAGERALILELILGREHRASELSKRLRRGSELNETEQRSLEALSKRPASSAASASPCGVIFGCIVRRLAADGRWSKSHRD